MFQIFEFNFDRNEFFNDAIACHCNMKMLADMHNLSQYAVYHFLNRTAEGRTIQEHVRSFLAAELMDSASEVYSYALENHSSNIVAALKAAEKIIANSGYLQGAAIDDPLKTVLGLSDNTADLINNKRSENV